MNKREAIQAMLDGKKVRQVSWEPEIYIYIHKNGIVYFDASAECALNRYEDDGWEIYKEPKPKQKFYRRKWGVSGLTLATAFDYYEKKDDFDSVYNWFDKVSDEWEEIEI